MYGPGVRARTDGGTDGASRPPPRNGSCWNWITLAELAGHPFDLHQRDGVWPVMVLLAVTIDAPDAAAHIELIDFGEFRQTNVTTGVLDRELAAGEAIHLTIHASATGFLLAPVDTFLTGRVDYTGDVDKTNNWDEVRANYDTFGSTAVVNGTVFLDANRNAVRDAGEIGGELAEPSLWWAPGQGQGVGITAAGQYSFTGIIGQQYELHFDVFEPDRYVGISVRVYIFTLAAGGRTIDYGVVSPNEPTPTSPASMPTTTTAQAPGAPAPGAPNPGGPSGLRWVAASTPRPSHRRLRQHNPRRRRRLPRRTPRPPLRSRTAPGRRPACRAEAVARPAHGRGWSAAWAVSSGWPPPPGLCCGGAV